jgi:hypothetical protein
MTFAIGTRGRPLLRPDTLKKRLAGDTAREATSDEVKELRAEARRLKETLAEVLIENRLDAAQHLVARFTILAALSTPLAIIYVWL